MWDGKSSHSGRRASREFGEWFTLTSSREGRSRLNHANWLDAVDAGEQVEHVVGEGHGVGELKHHVLAPICGEDRLGGQAIALLARSACDDDLHAEQLRWKHPNGNL